MNVLASFITTMAVPTTPATKKAINASVFIP
jgi:hypothetical protein